MYNQPREERVKTPLPEKLKNSFSFANQNQEDHLNEEELEQVMDNGNFMERANLDLFNQPVEDVEQFVVQDVVPTSTIPSYNRNKLRNEMMENNEETEEPAEETKTKKKRKKRKPKSTEDLKEEETNDGINNNLTESSQQKPEETTIPKKEVSSTTQEKDLFANMAKTHYLSISPDDLIFAKESEEAEVIMDEVIESKNLKLGGPNSLRQKTIFIENPVSGQFRKVKENDFNQSKHESEEIIEDEQEVIQREISSYNSTVLITNNNLFVLLLFVQGILVGFCTLHVLINIPLYSNLIDFVEWYSPISTILQKIYMLFTCVCSVLSIYILSIELRPPLPKGTLFTELLIIQSPVQRKSRMISSFIVRTLLVVGAAAYTIAFLCSVIIGFADEYFSFRYSSSGKGWTNNLTSTQSEQASRNAIGWHVVTGVRTLCCIIGWIAVVILFRTLRRQSETSFQQLLKDQPNQ